VYALNLTSSAGAYAGGGSYSSTPATWGNGTTPMIATNMPIWFRLTRVGTTYTAYLSISGKYWLSLGSVSNTFAASPDEFVIGLLGSASVMRVISFSGI